MKNILRIKQENLNTSSGPKSFSHSVGGVIEAESFVKWVEVKKGRKGGVLKKKNPKKKLILVFCFYLKRIDFYITPRTPLKNIPFEQFHIDEGVFQARTNNKINVDAVEVKTKEKVLLKLKCSNPVERDELLSLFRLSGIEETESKNEYSKPSSFDEFEEKDELEIGVSIENWKVSDFLKWSKEVRVGAKYDQTLFEVGEDAIRKHNLTGKTLMNDWEMKDIETLISAMDGLVDRGSQRRVKKELESMLEKGRYDHSFNRITNKAVNMLNNRESKAPSRLDIMKCRKEFGSRNIIEKKILYFLFGKEEEEDSEELFEHQSFSIKVNIVENFDDDRKRRMRKILGKVLEVKDLMIKKSKSSQFGFFHSSIAIGNLQLEYVDSEFVIIREVSSERAILSAGVGVCQVANSKMFARNLAERVLKWNVESKYDVIMSSSEKFQGNCQVFVMDMLKFLNVEWKAGSRVNGFIEDLKYRGTCEMIFKFDKKFGEFFFPTNSVEDQALRKSGHFIPKSHQELDLFVCGLFMKNRNFDRDYNGEYMLLKGFDRAFWLRFKSSGRDGLAPPNRRDPRMYWRFSGCPFTKPRGENRKDEGGLTSVGNIFLKKK